MRKHGCTAVSLERSISQMLKHVSIEHNSLSRRPPPALVPGNHHSSFEELNMSDPLPVEAGRIRRLGLASTI